MSVEVIYSISSKLFRFSALDISLIICIINPLFYLYSANADRYPSDSIASFF